MGIVVFLVTRSFIVGACNRLWVAIFNLACDPTWTQPSNDWVCIDTLDAINKWVKVGSMLPIRPIIIRFLPLAFKSHTVRIEWFEFWFGGIRCFQKLRFVRVSLILCFLKRQGGRKKKREARSGEEATNGKCTIFYLLPSLLHRFLCKRGKGGNQWYYSMRSYDLCSHSRLFTILIGLSFSPLYFTLLYPSVSLQERKVWKFWCDLMQCTTSSPSLSLSLISLISDDLLQERKKREN